MNVLSHLAYSTYYTVDPSTYDATYTAGGALLLGGIIFVNMLIALLVIGVIGYIVFALLLGRIFKKAGIDAWIAWVPFYNNWKLLELGGQQGFWAVLTIVPIVNYVSTVFLYIAMYHVGKRFGKGGEFVLWAIFLPIVWLAILAFDSSKWQQKTRRT